MDQSQINNVKGEKSLKKVQNIQFDLKKFIENSTNV